MIRPRTEILKHMIWAVWLCTAVAVLSACSWWPRERSVYEQDGARIWIEPDPTVTRGESDIRNEHPGRLTSEELRSLLRVIQVSGYSGVLVGMFMGAQPVPFLTDEELQKYSEPLAEGLGLAKPTERVSFSFPRLGKGYSEDRTAGSLFLRGRYIHVVVTDHSSIIQADTGGGEDIRDTKGMKLFISSPVQAAMVPDAEEPRWAHFETVHVSLNVGEVLTLRSAKPSQVSRDTADPVPSTGDAESSKASSSRPDLQKQVRELTDSNLELREKLDEQTKRMKDLSDQIKQLRLELDQTKPPKSSPRKSPSP